MNIESKLGKIVEAFDQKVVVNEVFERGLCDDAIKCRGSLAQPTVRATPIGIAQFCFE